MTKDIKEQVDYYASLPYTIYIKQKNDQGTYYVAGYVELPDLFFTGDTPEEALAELESIKRDWIETHLKLGNKMPEPLKANDYSGKINIRLPKSLHARLAILAELEGVSLNQLMVSELSKSAAHSHKNVQVEATSITRTSGTIREKSMRSPSGYK
jgi:antitoxin HicB